MLCSGKRFEINLLRGRVPAEKRLIFGGNCENACFVDLLCGPGGRLSFGTVDRFQMSRKLVRFRSVRYVLQTDLHPYIFYVRETLHAYIFYVRRPKGLKNALQRGLQSLQTTYMLTFFCKLPPYTLTLHAYIFYVRAVLSPLCHRRVTAFVTVFINVFSVF